MLVSHTPNLAPEKKQEVQPRLTNPMASVSQNTKSLFSSDVIAVGAQLRSLVSRTRIGRKGLFTPDHRSTCREWNVKCRFFVVVAVLVGVGVDVVVVYTNYQPSPGLLDETVVCRDDDETVFETSVCAAHDCAWYALEATKPNARCRSWVFFAQTFSCWKNQVTLIPSIHIDRLYPRCGWVQLL